jgi:hypothetical protein
MRKMSKHTPEPWQSELCLGNAYSICKKAANGDYIKRTMGELFNRADAHRLIACVNACAGMEDPEAEIARLRADYKVLRGALADLHACAIKPPSEATTMQDETDFLDAVESATEALDKTKEAE